jgi:hypothetical protein
MTVLTMLLIVLALWLVITVLAAMFIGAWR